MIVFRFSRLQFTHSFFKRAETIKLCSGFGQYHTNEADPEKPEKNLTSYATISHEQIKSMVDNPKSLDKPKAQWLIASTLLSRTFKVQEAEGQFYLLWADLDENPKELAIVAGALKSIIGNSQYELYTTKSATKQAQKARILIILATPLNGGKWQLCQDILNDNLEALGITPDRASERAAQLCYLPNKGKFYDSRSNRDGEIFNPLEAFKDDIEAKEFAITRDEKEVQIKREQTKKHREELKYTGQEPANLITAFNEAYTVEDIMLKAEYDQKGDKFRHPNSSSGRYTVSVKDGRVHSLSSDDPLYSDGKGAHDAFSAFTVLFHGGGNDAEALKDAGVKWIQINGESWNQVKQREHAKAQAKAKNPNINYTTSLLFSNVDELFDDLSLNSKLVEEMANAKFIIPNILVEGSLSVFAAPANGGKSALFRYFCELLSEEEKSVLYINCDAGAADLKKHYAHAETHNYKVVAPDAHQGRSANDVTGKLKQITGDNLPCENYVFIFDTLKKFTDVISKAQSKEFYNLLRTLTVQGATICLLGHCNKYKDENGQHIYEGTADLRNDVDNLIYFDSSLNEQTNILEVTTRPDKTRADFKPVSFNIDRNNELKVTPANSRIVILPDDDDKAIVEKVKDAIAVGLTSQGAIIERVKKDLGIGEKKIIARLKEYSAEPKKIFVKTKTGQGRGVVYDIA